MNRYTYNEVMKKIKDGEWDASHKVTRGKWIRIRDKNTNKRFEIFVESKMNLSLKKIFEAVITTKDLKKRAQLQKASEKENSFAGWINKNIKDINATGGNFEQLNNMIKTAKNKKEISMSDQYFRKFINRLEKSRNDTGRLSVIYNAMMSTQFGSVK